MTRCPVCSRWHDPYRHRTRTTKTCSHRCGMLYAWRTSRAWSRFQAHPVRFCAECRHTFALTSQQTWHERNDGIRSRFCSTDCATAWQRRHNGVYADDRERNKIHKRRQRAKRYALGLTADGRPLTAFGRKMHKARAVFVPGADLMADVRGPKV